MKDRTILYELASKIAEIAALPVQQERIKLWKNNNDLQKGSRPPVFIDQLPWHEIDRTEEMQLVCEDAFLRTIEHGMRAILYRWKHFQCDMVVRPFFELPKSIEGLNYGMKILEETRAVDVENDIVSHAYFDQLSTSAEVQALQADVIESDIKADEYRKNLLEEIFGQVLPVRLSGVQIHSGLWDRIAQMRSVTNILWDLVEKPELIEETVKKFVWLTMSTIDQCEELDLLDPMHTYIHCTGAFTKDLPIETGLDRKANASDCWSFGMAQMFSTVSPAMHEEFEIDLVRPLYERFGLIYYGCCEPLHDRIHIVRKIKNVRKISISPWANNTIAAEQIGHDYVFSSKINPAYIATGFDRESIEAQVKDVLAATERTGTPVELILKDVSTVENDIRRIDQWNNLVMAIIGA
jgi:hypothetical protein